MRLPAPVALLLTVALVTAGPLSAADEPLPRVRVQDRSYPGGALSRPFLGSTPGEGETFFKPDARAGIHLDRGNLEAEVLTTSLLRRLDLPALGSRTVVVEASWRDGQLLPRRHLQSELLGPGVTGGQPLVLHADLAWHQVPEVHWRELARLSLLDIVIGNGDRGRRNLMFRQDARGRWRPFAIDHNLAFVTRQVSTGGYLHYNFVPTFEGAPADRTMRGGESALRAEGGTPRRILERNRFYERLWNAARHDPGIAAMVLEEARFLERALSDGYLEWAVGELRDREITARDAEARRQELLEVARTRRDLLLEWVTRELPGGLDADPRTAGATLGRGLPEPLRDALARAPLTGNQRITLMQMLLPGNGVEPAALYGQLRACGVPEDLSRAVLEATTGVPADRVVDERIRRQVEEGLAERAERARRPPPATGPRRGFQVHSTAEGLLVYDLRGEPVSPEALAALEGTVRRLAAENPLPQGDRWIVLPDTAPGKAPDLRIVQVDRRGVHRNLGTRPPAPASLSVGSREVLGWDGLEGVAAPSRAPVEPEVLRELADALRAQAAETGAAGRVEEGRILWELSREAGRRVGGRSVAEGALLQGLETRIPREVAAEVRERVRRATDRSLREARARVGRRSPGRRPRPRPRGR